MVYGYNQRSGHLMHFENCSWGMNDEQLSAVCSNLRFALSNDNFKAWVDNSGHKIIKVDADLSFERFWNEYDHPRDKYRCEPLWNKLNDAERQYVFYNLAAYKRYMKLNASWYMQLLPETYLKAKNWHDEWDKLENKKKA